MCLIFIAEQKSVNKFFLVNILFLFQYWSFLKIVWEILQGLSGFHSSILFGDPVCIVDFSILFHRSMTGKSTSQIDWVHLNYRCWPAWRDSKMKNYGMLSSPMGWAPHRSIAMSTEAVMMLQQSGTLVSHQ